MDWFSPSLFAILGSRDGKALLEHTLPMDCTQVFQALAANRVRYLIVGGAAMNLHGIPRRTDDLDLFVDLTEDNLRRFLTVMEDLGWAPNPPGTAEGILREDSRKDLMHGTGSITQTFENPGNPATAIDILLQPPLLFHEAFHRRKEIPYGDLTIPVLSLEDMILFMTRQGRERDLIDVKMLEKVRELSRGQRTEAREQKE